MIEKLKLHVFNYVKILDFLIFSLLKFLLICQKSYLEFDKSGNFYR